MLKCEVIRVLLNIGQKISRKQYVSIILTFHLNAGINEVKVCSSKCRHTNRHYDRFAVRWPSAEKTISCDVFLANSNRNVLYWRSFWELLGAATEKLFSSVNKQKFTMEAG